MQVFAAVGHQTGKFHRNLTTGLRESGGFILIVVFNMKILNCSIGLIIRIAPQICFFLFGPH